MGKTRAPQEDMRPEVWLPPEDARLWHPHSDERIETPLDGRGLVDLDELVTLGKQTVVPGYDWTSAFNDVHHLQWPAAIYRSESPIAQEFRGLTRRKTFIPRQFHNWLHRITVEPPLPDKEVMYHSIEAERTARALATTAQLAVRLTRKRDIKISETERTRRLERYLDDYMVYVQNARLVPKEFQLLKLEQIEAEDVDGMLAANKRLGRMALQQVPIRLRGLQLAT